MSGFESPPTSSSERVVTTVAPRDLSAEAAGFWRRGLALMLDLFALAAIGRLMGALWFEPLSAFGQYGLALGASVALLYFGVLGSRVAGGATLGKRAFALRLVDADGRYLDVGTSIARASVLVLPWVLVQLSVPPGWLATLHAGLAWAAVAVLIWCAYLFVFNTPSRRSLPDLLTGTSVVCVPSEVRAIGRSEQRRLWRGHYAVALFALVAMIVGRSLLPSPALDDDDGEAIDRVRSALHREFDTVRVGAHLGYALSWRLAAVPGFGAERELAESRYVTVSVGLPGAPNSFESVVDRVATTLLHQFPEAFERDSIEITVLYGYDIGIAEKWIGRTIGLDPEQWRERIGDRSLPA